MLGIRQSTKVNGLQPQQLGLLINDKDPDSVAIGEYYQTRRQIPSENVVHLNVSVTIQITSTEFQTLKDQVDKALSKTVQALAIAWTIPFRVECNSITSAFALGYMDGPCKTSTCGWANSSLYYNSSSNAPFTDFNMRPAMMLAAYTVDQAKALIDRGIASDGTYPNGSAYIMNTTDQLRNSHTEILPDPSIMISFYTKGQTLSEAHRKSVLQTFQGAIIGEPLPNPWKQIICFEIDLLIQGVAKPLCPPGSTLRSNDFTKYFKVYFELRYKKTVVFLH